LLDHLHLTWAPPKSPVRIEYSDDLLKQLGRGCRRHDLEGVLYGIRRENNIRITATDRRNAFEPVGIYAARTRGRVFLTESDLTRLETVDGVALVIAGSSAGFFVREPDGSIQSIQSYQELAIPEEPAPRRSPWAWLAAGSLVILAMPFLCLPSQSLTIRADHQQLRVSWNRGTPGTLEILDAGHRATVPITASLTSLTYVPRTSNVEIRWMRPKPER
jgi:hypothetical protein